MKKRALIVDNDFFFVEFLQEVLEKRGYEVIKAYDGKEGISKLEEESVDLIMTDIIMPKIDGKQFIRYIRKKHPGIRIPIIAVSGVLVEQLERIDEIGADYYLAKGPMAQMEENINHFLDKLDIQPSPAPLDEVFFKPASILPRLTTVELMDIINFQQAITECIGIGVMVVDSDTRIISANPVAVELLNRSLEDLLSHRVVDLFPEPERTELIDHLRSIVQNDRLKRVSFCVYLRCGEVRIIITRLKVKDETAGWIMAMEEMDQWEERV